MANTRRVNAVKTEAAGEGTSFHFDGRTYTVQPTNKWDLDVLDAVEEGLIVTAVRLLLGETQWKAFRAKRRTVGDLNALFETLQRAAGIAGN